LELERPWHQGSLPQIYIPLRREQPIHDEKRGRIGPKADVDRAQHAGNWMLLAFGIWLLCKPEQPTLLLVRPIGAFRQEN
jgi:hypothetical protein